MNESQMLAPVADPPATIDTSLVQSGIAPKWPAPGAWIHYAQSPPIISEGRTQRQADPDELIVAAVLNYKWRQLTHDYRLRIPLDMDQLVNVAAIGEALPDHYRDDPFKFVNCNGWCNRDFIPHGAKLIADYSAEPESGDIVVVDFDPQTEAMMDYFGQKYAPQRYKETYGHTRGASQIKVYARIEGRDLLMNADAALLPVGETKIAAVVRNVQIKDVPVYGSLLKIETRETHHISRYENE